MGVIGGGGGGKKNKNQQWGKALKTQHTDQAWRGTRVSNKYNEWGEHRCAGDLDHGWIIHMGVG